MSGFRTILVAHDFSDTSHRALRAALQFARDLDATLVLLHVVDPAEAGTAEVVAGGDLEKTVSVLEREAEARLQALLADVDPDGPEVRTRACYGQPAQRILECVEEDEAMLLIVGTHGRTGLRRALVGSVAEAVLRESPVPVVVVRENARLP